MCQAAASVGRASLLLESSGGCKRKTRLIEKQCKRALLWPQRARERFLLGSVLPSVLRAASNARGPYYSPGGGFNKWVSFLNARG